jgi:hypothetical protein
VPTSALTDVATETGALGVLTFVGGLVGRPVEVVEVGREVVGSDVDVGAREEFGARVDVGVDDARAEVGLGELVGWDVVSSAVRDAGVPEVGLVGVVAEGAGLSAPGRGTDGAAGPPTRLTASMIR